MLVLALIWYQDKHETEPLIVCIGQGATLLTLLFEQLSPKINTERVSNKSKVYVDVTSGENVNTSDIDDSDVNIKTR